MKKLFLLAVIAAFAVSVSQPGAAGAATTLRMGLLVSNKALAFKGAQKFADYVKKETNGAYVIKLFPSQQLGSGKEMMQMLRMGTLDLYQGTNTQPAYLKEGRNFVVTATCYCFQSQDELVKFLGTPLFKQMVKQLSAGGVKLIGYMGSRSPRALTTTNTPVRKPSDMKGLKLRLPGIPAILAFFKACGASPTPMPFTEFFTAVKTGVVEGQDNGIEVVYPRGLWEVQKYFMKTDHALGCWMLYTSQKKWAKWPAKLRKAMEGGLKTAAAYCDAELKKSMAEAFKKVQEKGMIALAVDKKPFIAVGQKVWQELDGKSWEKGFMDKVQNQLKEFRK